MSEVDGLVLRVNLDIIHHLSDRIIRNQLTDGGGSKPIERERYFRLTDLSVHLDIVSFEALQVMLLGVLVVKRPNARYLRLKYEEHIERGQPELDGKGDMRWLASEV